MDLDMDDGGFQEEEDIDEEEEEKRRLFEEAQKTDQDRQFEEAGHQIWEEKYYPQVKEIIV